MNFMARATTPARRLGIVFLGMSLLAVAGSIAEWSINTKPIIYLKRTQEMISFRAPLAAPTGFYWVEEGRDFSTIGRPGWGLYDSQCVQMKRDESAKQNRFRAGGFNLDCRVEFRPFHYATKTEIATSFPWFLKNSFDSRLWITMPAIIGTILGVLLYCGIFSRLVVWIKHGSRQRD